MFQFGSLEWTSQVSGWSVRGLGSVVGGEGEGFRGGSGGARLLLQPLVAGFHRDCQYLWNTKAASILVNFRIELRKNIMN